MPLIIFVFALAIRLAYYIFLMDKAYVFTKYPVLASNTIAQGWLGTSVFGDNPLYTYFHALFIALFGSNALAAVQITQFVLGAAACVFTYFIGLRLFGKNTGITASIIQALYPTLIVYEGSLIPASLIVFLNLAFILCFLKFGDRRKPGYLFLSAAVFGLSANASPNVSIFLPFAILWILSLDGLALNKRIIHSLFFITVFFLSLIPVTLRNYIVGKDIVLVTGSAGAVFYDGNNPEANGVLFSPPKEVIPLLDEQISGKLETTDITVEHESYRKTASLLAGKELKPSEVSLFWFKKAIDFIVNHPAEYLKLELRKIYFSINSYEACDTADAYINCIRLENFPFINFGVIFPLGLLGILATWRHRKKLILLYGMVATYFLTLWLFFAQARFRLPVVPFLIIFAAYYLLYWLELFKARDYRKLFIYMVVFFSLALLCSHETRALKDIKKHQLAFHVYFNQAVNYYRKGDREKADELFRKAVELHPQLGPRVQRILK